MKNIFTLLSFVILFLTNTLVQSTDLIFAQQQPGWIEQSLPQSMTGSYLANRGDDVLIFTKSSSDIVYFFDIRINTWTEANLGSQQSFQKVFGAGNTAFTYSDEYVVAYSRFFHSGIQLNTRAMYLILLSEDQHEKDMAVVINLHTLSPMQISFMYLILNLLNGNNMILEL